MLDSLFYVMPPCGAIFDNKLSTFFVNGCRFHISIANMFEAKEWAAIKMCTLSKLTVEVISWTYNESIITRLEIKYTPCFIKKGTAYFCV